MVRDNKGRRRRSVTLSAEARLAAKLQRDTLKALESAKPKRRGSGQGSDALPAGTCVRCGFIAKHATPQECIDFLRDRLADLSRPADGKAKAEK